MSRTKMGLQHEDSVLSKERQKVEEPPMYKVLLHNDDYTTMEFVIMVLQNVFRKEITQATEIMLNVHKKGIGVAGVYSREIAETKVAIVRDLARQNEHPLRCTMEKE